MKENMVYESAIFEHAYELIEPEAQWCQNFYAKDSEGKHVMESDPAACCWCSVGALRNGNDYVKELYPEHKPEIQESYFSIYSKFYDFCRSMPQNFENPAQMNDGLSHTEVLAVWQEFGEEQGYIPAIVTE